MRIRLHLRHLRWHSMSVKKMTSRLLKCPVRGAAREVQNGLKPCEKTVRLSMDLIRFVALLLLFCGCSKSPPPQPKASPHEHGHGHTHSGNGEHHSHEEEHGILPYKPKTFAEAVIQVDKRGHALLSHRHGHHITEWFEILGWLPEIAADTDLTKPGWDSVVRISRDLETWSAGWKSGEKTQPDPARLDALIAELNVLVTQLPVRD